MNVTIDVTDESGEDEAPTQAELLGWLRALHLDELEEQEVQISLRLVDEAEAARLNSQWRQRDYATNVLSFPAGLPDSINHELGYRPLGDLVLCPAVISREAISQNKPLKAHWAHLLLHGCLHLLGYEHDDEARAATMEALEIQSLQRLGIANPYLIG